MLGDVLSVVRLGSAVVAQAELVPPWGLGIDPLAQTAVHVVLRGACWLRTVAAVGADPVRMQAGDVTLIRAGVGHSIADTLHTPARPFAEAIAEMPRRLREHARAPTGETTRVLCAKYLFQNEPQHPLTRLLPPCIHLRSESASRHEPLQLLLQVLRHEAGASAAGSELVVPRLVDSLLVFVMRAWLDEQPLDAGGWFGALRDPAVSRALSVIHARPAEPWSVETLGREVAHSRATFARRFSELVGEAPVAYLTRWRMCLTAKLLTDSQLSLEQIAPKVGYETAAALSKAFRRIHGEAPGRYRARARAGAWRAGPPSDASEPGAGSDGARSSER